MKKYQIIYADPPWSFTAYNPKTAQKYVGNVYGTMTTKDICALGVGEIADENAVLFMWATFPNLPDALQVIDAWGFEYKTNAFTWIKRNKKHDGLFTGMGYYTRSNAEICLLATKGNILKRKSKSVHSVIITNIEKHSKKPDEARKRIVELFGDLSRVELFARQASDGWDVFGNEVANSIRLPQTDVMSI